VKVTAEQVMVVGTAPGADPVGEGKHRAGVEASSYESDVGIAIACPSDDRHSRQALSATTTSDLANSTAEMAAAVGVVEKSPANWSRFRRCLN
jgi:hypothetical protein